MSGDHRDPPPTGRDADGLDPGARPRRWEATVDSILRAATPELERRASPPGVAGQIGRWARPLVAAAAAVIVVAAGALLGSVGETASPAGALGPAGDSAPGADIASSAPTGGGPAGDAGPGVATAVYPGPVAAWMESGDEPTVEEIVFSASLGRDGR